MADDTITVSASATPNAWSKRDGNGDIAHRRVSLPAVSGGLDNLGYERAGVAVASATFTIDNQSVNGEMWSVTCGASNRTANLPAAATWPGQVLEIIKVDTGVGTVIVDPNGSETINGVTTFTIYAQYQCLRIRSDGTGWAIVGYFNGDISPGDITVAITDPGNGAAIPVTRSGYVSITSTGADTRTLAIPTFVGQQLLLIHAVDGGSVAVTAASAINITGNTIMTATAVRAWILLTASLTGTTKVWTVTATDGFALT